MSNWSIFEMNLVELTGFFSTLAGFFSRGRYKMSPAVSMSNWSIFERNLVGLADFAGSNSNGWTPGPVSAGFDKKNRNWENCTKQAARFVQFALLRSKNRNWTSWPSVGTSSLQNQPIPLASSRKMTNCSLRQQGTIFNVPAGENPFQSAEN